DSLPPYLVNASCSVFDGIVSDLTSENVKYNTPATLNTVPQPVYSPPGYASGSSLSHFNKFVSGLDYVMHPSTSGGANRTLTDPEIDVLCDLGYSLFGGVCSNGYPEGVDDAETTTLGGTVVIDVVDNDDDPESDPITIGSGTVEIINGGGSFTILPGDEEIEYTASSSFCGTATLRYRPTDGDKTGNITTVLVDVECDFCPDDACSLVCNGGFENGPPDTAILDGYVFDSCPTIVDNWCGMSATSDLFMRGSSVAGYGIPDNYASWAVAGGVDSHNGTPNDRYVGGEVNPGVPYLESIYTELVKPLDPGQLYELSFWTLGTFANYGMIAALNDTDPSHSNMVNGSFDEIIMMSGTPEFGQDVWIQHTMTFSTSSSTRQYLAIEPVMFSGAGYNWVYMDDVKIREVGNVSVDIFKSVNDPTPSIGDTITYQITVCNMNSFPLNIAVQDVLPPGLVYVPSTFTYPTHTFFGIAPFTCEFVNLEALVTPDVELNTPITNCVETLDPNIDMCLSFTNMNQCADIVVEATDIAISKKVSDTEPDLGDTITYTVTVQNQGPSAASNVVIDELLPAGVSYLSHLFGVSGATASYDPGTGELLADLDPGGSFIMLLQVVVSGSNCDPVTNTATLVSLDQSDVNFVNDSASVTFQPDPQKCECVDAPDGMVGWWSLDETTGPLAEERIYGPLALWFGTPTPEPGMVEGCLDFNGFNSYVESE
ncbi:MAG: DUF11 domain-containing protein, partial [Actinomycetia bacterium]|nr:DUF11 domain-containing protein [Actinomycetes bacterium]